MRFFFLVEKIISELQRWCQHLPNIAFESFPSFPGCFAYFVLCLFLVEYIQRKTGWLLGSWWCNHRNQSPQACGSGLHPCLPSQRSCTGVKSVNWSLGWLYCSLVFFQLSPCLLGGLHWIESGSSQHTALPTVAFSSLQDWVIFQLEHQEELWKEGRWFY